PGRRGPVCRRSRIGTSLERSAGADRPCHGAPRNRCPGHRDLCGHRRPYLHRAAPALAPSRTGGAATSFRVPPRAPGSQVVDGLVEVLLVEVEVEVEVLELVFEVEVEVLELVFV